MGMLHIIQLIIVSLPFPYLKIKVLTHITVTESRVIGWMWHAAYVRKTRNAYRILERKCEGKTPIGGHKCCWEGKIVCEAWIGHVLSEIGTVAGSYEYGNTTPDS
jgi:hypothetical protein